MRLHATLAPAIAALTALAALGASLVSCRACKNDHPFVPYHIEAGGPMPEPSAADGKAPPAHAEGGTVAPTPAVIAPAHASSWVVGSTSVDAPAGGVFRQGLAWDVDGDGREDVLALVEHGGDEPTEELVFYRGVEQGPPVPVSVPLGAQGTRSTGVRIDPGNTQCTRRERLARVGRRSAAVELGQVCTSWATGKEPARTVGLVAWSDGWKVRLALPVADPPGSALLTLDVDGADVDGDGLDDATLAATLEGGGAPFEPGPSEKVAFHWLDRPAGMSREPGEPERSFHAIAAGAAARATRPKEAAAALAVASAGRFLFEAICGESAARRVSADDPASPLTCEAGKALEDLGLAQVRALVTLGDPLRAVAALDASGAPPAVRTPSRQAEGAGWITAAVPVTQATSVRAIGAVPRTGTEGSSWGALRFEPAGTVLVRTLAGVVRVEPVHGDETDATGEVAWPMRVTSPDGLTSLSGAFAPCRGAALEVLLSRSEGAKPGLADGAATEGGDATYVPVPVMAPIGARCRGAGREPVPASPIAWGAGGLTLSVAGVPVVVNPDTHRAEPMVLPPGLPVSPGSPRSPDGAAWVAPTSLGLMVRGAHPRLLRAKELEHGYGELRDCTLSDDASRVACSRGGVAFVGVWPPP